METNAKIVDAIRKGDLFETSWGYDQTNYDFLIVLSISKTGKTAKCQMTSAKNIGASGCSDLLEPTQKAYGDIFTMQVRNWNGDLCLRGSYPYCCDGSMNSSHLGTFSRVENGRVYHETNSMFGH